MIFPKEKVSKFEQQKIPLIPNLLNAGKNLEENESSKLEVSLALYIFIQINSNDEIIDQIFL